ncbi:MAG TPA: sigma-54 dependent transcriptional regulator [Vicinamibacteria bacterium]|nr:sigma-54 dependent transcriptional regulator [Vicinamibacteria bacterium]
MKRVLVVDDEPSMREMLGIMMRKEGFDVFTAETRARASQALASEAFDMVITDLRLPDGDGLEVLRQSKTASPESVAIVMTAFGSHEMNVAAIRLGADAYLTKPFDVEELRLVVRGVVEKQKLEQENRLLKAEFRSRHGLDRILGVSKAMDGVFKMVRSVAETTSTVLITGESGTGKELVAKAIHALSPRREAAFVSINCGALTETLLESELFGHMKGAFTDAHQNKKGLFEAAHRGTLFLDEVGETPPAMQVKLLRAIQDKRIRRVGGTEEIDVDVRIVAATNRSLAALLREKRFREDLYYRLNVIPIHIPPLRERREDIPLLAGHFLEQFSREMGKAVAKISQEAMERLCQYAWPGNVRELENVIERAVALESTPAILVERLPESLQIAGLPPALAAAEPELSEGFSLDDHIREIEGQLLRRALRQAAGDRGQAARLLGITPRSLRYLLTKHRAVETSLES